MKRQNLVAAMLIPWVLVSCASRETTSPGYQYNGARVDDTNIYGSGNKGQQGASSIWESPRPWPRAAVSGTRTNTIYQPQITSWDGTNLVARSAVAVQDQNLSQPLYGVITFGAKGLVPSGQRYAVLSDFEIISSEFPSAPNRAAEFSANLKADLSKELGTISLAALESGVAAAEGAAKVTTPAIINTPPKVYTSSKPAVLVLIDGAPVYRDVPKTQLQRVINTRALLLRDRGGVYYMHLLDGYVRATSLNGPWAVGAPPIGAPIAEKEVQGSNQVDMMRGGANPIDKHTPTLGIGEPPVVFVSTEPAELITFSGAPDYVPIPGTDLLYATNTTANVFKLLRDQQTYVLLSGRWFKAPSLEGPWQFVPGAQLPGDFARIPDSSPKENVKASVPGTAQAREALVADSIPQTTSIPRGSRMEDPKIDGAPRLAAIEGTPLQYVMNSATPIIKVDEKSWYACQNGVWYVATSVGGPWMVADSVPAVIYTIPVSSPMHYVTYVRVYDADSRVVYQGYTPGYLGTVVSDGVVVYGTGYYYTPWVGSVWYGPPCTWGYACAPYWAPWGGWSFGFGFGWTWCGYYGAPYYYWAWYPYPYWGPYGYYCGYYGYHDHSVAWNTGADVYRPPVQAVQGGGNWRGGYGRAYNSRTGAVVAGEPATVRNVFAHGTRVEPIRSQTSAGVGAYGQSGRPVYRGSPAPAGWRGSPTRVERGTPSGRSGSDEIWRSDRGSDGFGGSYSAPPSRGGDSGMRGMPPSGGGGGGGGGGGISRGSRP